MTMTATMPAYRLLEWGRAGFDEVPVPEPAYGEVLVRVGGAGICGSDLHFCDLPAGGWPHPPPFTLGHENAGWVERCGAGADRFAQGAAVLATGVHSCGLCHWCVRGEESLCPAAMGGRGCGSDGGLAPYVVVPERELIPLRRLHPRDAAPLADAGHTSYAAVKRVLPKLGPGTTALVIGAGGLGGYAIQYLRLLSGARVVAVDRLASRLHHALELGAHEALPADEPVAEAVRRITGGRGAEAVLDFVGDEATIIAALKAAAPAGTVVLVGLGEASVPLVWGRTPPLKCELLWWVGGSRADLEEVVALAEGGLLRIEVEHFPLADVEVAFGRLRRGELRGRAVITPSD